MATVNGTWLGPAASQPALYCVYMYLKNCLRLSIIHVYVRTLDNFQHLVIDFCPPGLMLLHLCLVYLHLIMGRMHHCNQNCTPMRTFPRLDNLAGTYIASILLSQIAYYGLKQHILQTQHSIVFTFSFIVGYRCPTVRHSLLLLYPS